MKNGEYGQTEREIAAFLEERGFVEVDGQEIGIDPDLVDLLARPGALAMPVRLFLNPRFGDPTGPEEEAVVKIIPAGSIQETCPMLGEQFNGVAAEIKARGYIQCTPCSPFSF